MADLTKNLFTTKSSLNKDHERMLEEFEKAFGKVREHETQLQASIDDSQRLYDNYQESFTEQEKFI